MKLLISFVDVAERLRKRLQISFMLVRVQSSTPEFGACSADRNVTEYLSLMGGKVNWKCLAAMP